MFVFSDGFLNVVIVVEVYLYNLNILITSLIKINSMNDVTVFSSGSVAHNP